MLFHAGRTDGVAEFCIGIFGHIGFDPVPIPLVIPDLVAEGTDGNNAPQGFDSLLIRRDGYIDKEQGHQGNGKADGKVHQKGGMDLL